MQSTKNDIILLHDDLLATGGTMKAAMRSREKIPSKEGLL